MHDCSTVLRLSDKELAELIRTIDRKLGCVGENEQVFNMLYAQKQVLLDQQMERQQMLSMGIAPPTYDTSTPYEDKDKK